jgi:2-oxoglutarate/2-oxoacid ferredoxin oxidoreductase subunit beta
MSNTIPIDDIPKYSRKDFVSDQVVRWCPGCGDYAILAAIQKSLPQVGIRKEDIVFISGIGCSSRFPYYMDTYGMHTVHGRAPTVATGLKVANPDLSVWVVTGDGDGLSIGGNHLLHIFRRNVDVNILLFNNRIYGLTKGQYSPTSEVGKKTKSTPMGSIDRDINPCAVALSTEATFVARTLDADTKHMEKLFIEASSHAGTSFMEILQNCVIFNDGAFEHVTDRKLRPQNALYLEHGQPMVFGEDKDKGIRMNGFTLEVVELGDEYTEADLLVHDMHNPTLAYMISRMSYPQFPVPMGIIYQAQAPVYEQEVIGQVATAKDKRTPDLNALYFSDDTWTVAGEAAYDTAEMRSLAFGQTSDVASEFDEAYIESMKDEAPISGIQATDIHEGLAQDPIVNLVDMERDIITMQAKDTLQDALTLMTDKNIGALVITDEQNRPIGIFTEFDVLRKVVAQVEDLSGALLAEYMTRNPDTLPAHAPIAQALQLMSVHKYRHVPITDEGNVVIGIISFRDVVRYIETYFDTNDV